MDRRTFLAGTGATLALPIAGCTDTPIASEETTSNETDDGLDGDPPDTAPDETVWQPMDGLPDPPEERPVVDFETASLTAAVSGDSVRTNDRFSVRAWFDSGATAASPATITAVVSNSRSFEQTIRSRRLVLLQDPLVLRTDDRDVAYLAPGEGNPIAESVPEYSRDDDGRWRIDGVSDDWYPDRITAPPESGFVANYHLLGHHDRSEPPIGPGRYRRRWQSGGLSVTLWPTDTPGPDVESSLAGADPPALPDAEEMRWYHDADRATSVYLQPDPEAVELPGAVSVDLYNHSRESLGGNPYYWRLYKLVDGQWFPVSPWGWNQPYREIRPGDRDEQRLVLFHGESIRISGARTAGHLGGGQYAYEVGYSASDETYAAIVDVEAPTLTVDPEDGAEVVESGETTVVELPNYADARRPGRLTVDRTDADPTTADSRLIPEQLPRRPHRGLRNAFTHFEPGVERVEVRTDRGTALRMFGYEEGVSRTVAYEGVVYELSGELEGEE